MQIVKEFSKLYEGASIHTACRETRLLFKEDDLKGHSTYSNILIGFGSESLNEIKSGIDFLLVVESHGGGHSDAWNNKLPIEEESLRFKNYYLNSEIESFHQSEIRKILKAIPQNKSWFYTDLIKCFVKKKGKNFEVAKKYCGQILKTQINLLRPKQILAFGKAADIPLTGYGFEHFSLPFPSSTNANRWAKHQGLENAIEFVNRNY